MSPSTVPKDILIAEDDDDHYFLIKKAMTLSQVKDNLHRVLDGTQLMDFLKSSPLPDMIILDLNLPRKDGRQVLRELKADKLYSSIPVAVLTTTVNHEDEIVSRNLGAKFHFKKPVFLKEYAEIIK